MHSYRQIFIYAQLISSGQFCLFSQPQKHNINFTAINRILQLNWWDKEMRTKEADVVSHQSALVVYLITNKIGMIFLIFGLI